MDTLSAQADSLAVTWARACVARSELGQLAETLRDLQQDPNLDEVQRMDVGHLLSVLNGHMGDAPRRVQAHVAEQAKAAGARGPRLDLLRALRHS